MRPPLPNRVGYFRSERELYGKHERSVRTSPMSLSSGNIFLTASKISFSFALSVSVTLGLVRPHEACAIRMHRTEEGKHGYIKSSSHNSIPYLAYFMVGGT